MLCSCHRHSQTLVTLNSNSRDSERQKKIAIVPLSRQIAKYATLSVIRVNSTMERSVATARRRPTPRVAGPGSRARGPPRTSKTYHAGGWRRASSSLRGGLASALRAVSQEKGGSMTESEVSHQVDVDLGDRSYPIYIGENLLDRGDLLRKHIPGKQVLIVTNETIAPIYLERVTRVIREADPALQVESVVLPDGEQHKNTEVLMKVG